MSDTQEHNQGVQASRRPAVIYDMPTDAWRVVCHAMGYAAHLALIDHEDDPRNEGQRRGLARFTTEKLQEQYERRAQQLTNDLDMFTHFFTPNFIDTYNAVRAMSPGERAATRATITTTSSDGGLTDMARAYEYIYADRAREIITKERNRFMQP